jgi:hypothetical protein
MLISLFQILLEQQVVPVLVKAEVVAEVAEETKSKNMINLKKKI